MFIDFFAYIIDYDSKLFASIRGLSHPGFLTNEYFAKKQVRYLTPMRLFVYMMIVFFAIMSFKGLDDFKFDLNQSQESDNVSLELSSGIDEDHYNFLEKMSPKMRVLSLIKSLVVELQNKKVTMINDMQNGEESKDDESKGDKDLKDEQYLVLIDATIETLKSLETLSAYDEDDVTNFVVFNKEYAIKIVDLNTLTADQLIKKYDVDYWLDKLVFEQIIKFNKDSNGFTKFIIQNLTWVIILEVLLMSMIFKLFYFRTKKLYVEHFIYHLHIRAFIFLIGIILLLIPLESNGWVISLVMTVVALYVLGANFKVYKQSKTLTFIKFIIFGLLEFIILTLSFIFVVSVSGFLF
jgi:hypothetical protein